MAYLNKIFYTYRQNWVIRVIKVIKVIKVIRVIRVIKVIKVIRVILCHNVSDYIHVNCI